MYPYNSYHQCRDDMKINSMKIRHVSLHLWQSKLSQGFQHSNLKIYFTIEDNHDVATLQKHVVIHRDKNPIQFLHTTESVLCSCRNILRKSKLRSAASKSKAFMWLLHQAKQLNIAEIFITNRNKAWQNNARAKIFCANLNYNCKPSKSKYTSKDRKIRLSKICDPNIN